ncbi:YqhG family protein [Salibacterium sp. K-3]
MTTDLLHYLHRYFEANNASILHRSEKKIQVKLTEALDKELMNRPFYWQYVKSSGNIGEPMTLTFFTDRESNGKEKGEWLHAGTPRLHQIFQSARQKGRWTLLYEHHNPRDTPAPLYPWLVVNVKYSFLSHQRKDKIVSYGLQLIHGQLVDHMMEHLQPLHLDMIIPDHSFPMASLIQVDSGLLRIKNETQRFVKEHPDEWAEKAEKKMYEELALLHACSRASSFSEKDYERQKNEIRNRYQPEIQIDIINSGLFYLSRSSI